MSKVRVTPPGVRTSRSQDSSVDPPQGGRVAGDVDSDHVAEQDPGPAQGGVQADGDVPRLDHTGGDVGQQGAVQQVVGGAGKDQVGGVGRQVLLEAPYAVEAGEAAADDQHPGTPLGCCAHGGAHG
jgi:hypothetical protein